MLALTTYSEFVGFVLAALIIGGIIVVISSITALAYGHHRKKPWEGLKVSGLLWTIYLLFVLVLVEIMNMLANVELLEIFLGFGWP